MRAATWQRTWFLICVPFQTTGAEGISEHFRDFFWVQPSHCMQYMPFWYDLLNRCPHGSTLQKKPTPKPQPEVQQTPLRLASTLPRSMNNGSERWFNRWSVDLVDDFSSLGALERHGCTRKDNHTFLKCFFPQCSMGLAYVPT